MAVSRREFCTVLTGGALAKKVGNEVFIFEPDASGYTAKATGGTKPRRLADHFADVFNVLDYGAKRDGSTDDTDAFNAALLACYNAGGGVVFVPHGTYCIKGKIKQGGNTTLQCDSGALLVRGARGGFWANWLGYETDYTGEVELTTPSGYSGHGNIAVIGGVWDIKGYEFGGNADGFIIGYAEGVLFRDVIIKNGVGVHAIDMCACRNVLFENCKFYGCSSPENIYKECIQLDHCVSESTFFGTRDGTPCYNIVVKDCYFGPNPEKPSDGTWPVFVGAHGADENGRHHDILIENCCFESNNEDLSPAREQAVAVRSFAWRGLTIKNCTANGVRLFQCTSVSPENSHMESYRGNEDILIDGCNVQCSLAVYNSLPADFSASSNAGRNKNIKIHNCKIDGGIQIQAFNGVDISNNEIVSNNLQAIFLVCCANVSIVENKISGMAVQIQSRENIADLANFDYGNIYIANNILQSILFIRFQQKTLSVVCNIAEKRSTHFLQCNSVSNTDILVSNNIYSQNVDAIGQNFIASNSYSDKFNAFDNVVKLNSSGAYAGNTINTGRDIRINPVLFHVPASYGGEPPIQFDGVGGAKIAWKQGGQLSFGSFNEDILNTGKTITTHFAFDTGSCFPTDDNVKALGKSGFRWSTVYAGTGTINTSDEREKSAIKDISESVFKAWGKVNFKQYLFNSSIEEKGADKARIHTGLIAQRIKEAFESEGLNPNRFALFCYDEWPNQYETKVVIDAEAEHDEDGLEISPAVTHEEQVLLMKAGNRYAIRYDEALALECAYQRWLGAKRDARIAELEARLAQLEARFQA